MAICSCFLSNTCCKRGNSYSTSRFRWAAENQTAWFFPLHTGLESGQMSMCAFHEKNWVGLAWEGFWIHHEAFWLRNKMRGSQQHENTLRHCQKRARTKTNLSELESKRVFWVLILSRLHRDNNNNTRTL